MNGENETAEDPYAVMLRDANAEIERLTGGSTAHLEWFRRRHPDNDRVLRNFIVEIRDSAGHLPLSAFQSLLGVLVASHRHIWTLWLIRDELPAQFKSTAPFSGFGQPN